MTLGAVPRSNRIDPSSFFSLSLSLFLSFRGVIELQRYRQSRVINSRRKDVRSLVGNGVKMGQATHARYKPVVQRHSVRSYCPRARFTSSFFHFFFSFLSPPSFSRSLFGIERFLDGEVSIRLCHKYGDAVVERYVGPGWCVDSAIMRRERETLLYAGPRVKRRINAFGVEEETPSFRGVEETRAAC